MTPDSHILTINCGSSSIKFSLYVLGETERLVLEGKLARIGLSQGFFQVEDQAGHQLTAQELDLPDHGAALKTLLIGCKASEIGNRFTAWATGWYMAGQPTSSPNRHPPP
jgi:acetate kinase